MEHKNHTVAKLLNGNALVTTDKRSIEISRHDRTTDKIGCPMQMLSEALGACIVLTLDAVAKNKRIPIAGLQALVDYQTNGDGENRFRVEIDIDGSLSDRERKILFQSARLCEVGKVLAGDVQIDYHLQ